MPGLVPQMSQSPVRDIWGVRPSCSMIRSGVPVPSRRTMYPWSSPPSSRWKRIDDPSADQDGNMFSPSNVTRVGTLRWRSHTQMSEASSGVATVNAR